MSLMKQNIEYGIRNEHLLLRIAETLPSRCTQKSECNFLTRSRLMWPQMKQKVMDTHIEYSMHACIHEETTKKNGRVNAMPARFDLHALTLDFNQIAKSIYMYDGFIWIFIAIIIIILYLYAENMLTNQKRYRTKRMDPKNIWIHNKIHVCFRKSDSKIHMNEWMAACWILVAKIATTILSYSYSYMLPCTFMMMSRIFWWVGTHARLARQPERPFFLSFCLCFLYFLAHQNQILNDIHDSKHS